MTAGKLPKLSARPAGLSQLAKEVGAKSPNLKPAARLWQPLRPQATVSAKSFATLNLITVLAGTSTRAPVDGLRACRASRLAEESFPIPLRVTCPPRFQRLRSDARKGRQHCRHIYLGFRRVLGNCRDQIILVHKALQLLLTMNGWSICFGGPATRGCFAALLAKAHLLG